MSINRQASHATILSLLRERPHTTRTEIVATSGLSKATVSEAISYLLSLGLIAEVGKRQPGRGRSQVVIELQSEKRLVLGAQFAEQSCRVVLTDLVAGPVTWAERTTNGIDPESFIDTLAECCETLLRDARAPVLGIGVGVPGLVSPDGRRVMVSVPHGWTNVPICDLIEARIGLPAVVTNRAKAAALGEYWQGDHATDATLDHLFYVYMGAGIVSGFVERGHLYLGSSGAFGELGHMTVEPGGRACPCGNSGCLYTVASESAILRDANDLMDSSSSPLTLDDVIAGALAGDEPITNVVNDAARWIGIALANVVNLMNPSAVVLGGPISQLGRGFTARVRSEVEARALGESLEHMAMLTTRLGDAAGPIGAAALFLDSLRPEQIIEAPEVFPVD